jgi:hypothetical protein
MLQLGHQPWMCVCVSVCLCVCMMYCCRHRPLVHHHLRTTEVVECSFLLKSCRNNALSSKSKLSPVVHAMVYLNQNLTWYIERWLNIRTGDMFVLFVCFGFICASIGLLLHGALQDRCLSVVDRGRCDQVSFCAWNVSAGYCHRP